MPPSVPSILLFFAACLLLSDGRGAPAARVNFSREMLLFESISTHATVVESRQLRFRSLVPASPPLSLSAHLSTESFATVQTAPAHVTCENTSTNCSGKA